MMGLAAGIKALFADSICKATASRQWSGRIALGQPSYRRRLSARSKGGVDRLAYTLELVLCHSGENG